MRQTEREPVGAPKYALDDDHDEWQDRPHQRDEDATLADDDEYHWNVSENIGRLLFLHSDPANLECALRLYHTDLVTTTACHGDDFIVAATLERGFESKRLPLVAKARGS